MLGVLLTGLLHQGLLRGLAVGFYLGGVGLLGVGCLLGTRPPVRTKGEGGLVGWFRWSGGGVRFATPEEQNEAINLPAVLIAIGVCLLVVGAALDSRHRLF